ncbi:unnamed protein product [Sphagnum jensenii]|uniref:Maturase K n=1 Tax=Sphagnum jensenii TaxID=128206 RepID=A0ABP1A848_9BRYO
MDSPDILTQEEQLRGLLYNLHQGILCKISQSRPGVSSGKFYLVRHPLNTLLNLMEVVIPTYSAFNRACKRKLLFLIC